MCHRCAYGSPTSPANVDTRQAQNRALRIVIRGTAIFVGGTVAALVAYSWLGSIWIGPAIAAVIGLVWTLIGLLLLLQAKQI
jgi:hypothetical protein